MTSPLWSKASINESPHCLDAPQFERTRSRIADAPSFGDTNLPSLLGSSVETEDSEAAISDVFALGGDSVTDFSASKESSTRSKAFCFF
jgi:hypothetical protein